MNANEITFGVEIETTVNTGTAARNQLVIGSYHHGVQVPYLPAGWTAERDSSIASDRSDRTGCEIVSPVLRGEAGLRQLQEVARTLEAKGHRVNATCGVHIHIGWDPQGSAVTLARLITITPYCEPALYAITGTKLRERGRYCGGVRKYGDAKKAKESMDPNRYHALNINNLARGTRPTVEFRVFSGSTSAVKLVAWVLVCLGLVDRAMSGKRLPAWAPAALKAGGGWAKGGPGQSELERLIGFLGWTPCYEKIQGKAFGWVECGLTKDEVKTELRRLARKYDEME